jgi:acetylglutamate kinase
VSAGPVGDQGPAQGPVVVKLGGRTQDDPALPGALAAAWRASGGRLVVVHGGGDAVSALQRARGVAPEFVGGRRVTSAADVDDLRMALSGAANKRLVAAMQGAGVPAVGVSGEDGALIAAAPAADARLGRVGEVGRAPARVDARLLALLLGAGYCPVVSPVSADAAEPGAALNVNGDDAAAAVAAALGAAELLFVADVPGVLVDGRPLGTVDARGARSLVAAGTAAGGMAAKLEAALAAASAGVPRVRVGDAAMLADAAAGTAVAGGAAREGAPGAGGVVAGAAGTVPAAV